MDTPKHTYTSRHAQHTHTHNTRTHTPSPHKKYTQAKTQTKTPKHMHACTTTDTHTHTLWPTQMNVHPHKHAHYTQASRHTGWLIPPVPWGGCRSAHLGRAGFLTDCFHRVLSLEGVGDLLLSTQWYALQDCYPRHPLYPTPPSLALALATAPSHVTESLPEPGQLWSGAPTQQ